MNNRILMLVLSAVLIAAVLSGCVQEISEIKTPDADPPTPAPENIASFVQAPPSIANWKYVSYRNLSISNAPALNQTARITYSIIPDRDIEVLLVYISFLDGFEFVEVEGERLLTWGNGKMPVGDLERCARWFPTNLSKGEMYQFNATIKAVKTGNWTITGLDWENRVYISVSEDSAYISDEPFPKPIPMAGHSKYTDTRANMIRTSSKPSGYNLTPRPGNVSDAVHYDLWWDGTGWKWVKM